MNTSHLTTLIIAGCENITDTFLLSCFIPDVTTSLHLTSSTQDCSVQKPLCAASSCYMVNDWIVGSKQAFCHKLNQRDNSVSPFHHACAAVVTNKELHNSVALNCTQRCSIDNNYHRADAPELLCSSADNLICQSVVTPAEVGDMGKECHQSAVSCSQMNQSVTEYCTSKTCGDDKWTTVLYKLEYLDMSGCWKISDLSIRYVIIVCCLLLLIHTKLYLSSMLILNAVFQFDLILM